jgi:hypothetical protein
VELLERALRCVNYGARKELMKAHRSNSDLFALLIRDGYETGDDVLERADEPGVVLEKYIMNVSASRRGIPDWVMASKYMKLEMLERTPFHVLAGATLSEQLRGQLIELITKALGDSADEAWVLFESVANSSGASLGDVIAATTALTATS